MPIAIWTHLSINHTSFLYSIYIQSSPSALHECVCIYSIYTHTHTFSHSTKGDDDVFNVNLACQEENRMVDVSALVERIVRYINLKFFSFPFRNPCSRRFHPVITLYSFSAFPHFILLSISYIHHFFLYAWLDL